MGLQLVTALKQYFLRRGLLGLAQHVMAEALAHRGAQKRDAERGRALFSLGQICNFMGRYREASGHLEESLAIGREIGDRQRVASALQALGIVLTGQGDLVGARKYFEEALVLAQEIGNKREIAGALNNRAQLYRLEGDLAAAQRLYEQVLDVVRELGDHEDIAIALLNLAMIHIGRRSCRSRARDAARDARDCRRDAIEVGQPERLRGFGGTRCRRCRLGAGRQTLWCGRVALGADGVTAGPGGRGLPGPADAEGAVDAVWRALRCGCESRAHTQAWTTRWPKRGRG